MWTWVQGWPAGETCGYPGGGNSTDHLRFSVRPLRIIFMFTKLRSLSKQDSRAQESASMFRSSQDISSVEVHEQRLSLRGYRFSYKYYTSPDFTGEPFFFISGAFQNMQSWKAFINYVLERRNPVIVADLPGAGGSAPLPVNYGLNFFSEALRLILEDISCPKVSIVSVSYGTPIGYTFSHQYPNLVKRLVLAGTMKEIPSHMRESVLDNLKQLQAGRMGDFAQSALDVLLNCDPLIPVRRRNVTQRVLRAQLASMSKDDQTKYLFNTLRLLVKSPLDVSRPPKCPTLVFTGEHDRFTRPEDCLEIAQSIPCSYFTTIKEADHLFHMEQPAVTCHLSYSFIREQEIDGVCGINSLTPSGFLNSKHTTYAYDAA